MNFQERINGLRNEMLNELNHGNIFYESDLDERYDNEELEDLYLGLPTTIYVDKHGYSSEAKLIGYHNDEFNCYIEDLEETVSIHHAYIKVETIAEYLNF